jgi:hypothetical protein
MSKCSVFKRASINAEWIKIKYVDEQQSMVDIAKLLNCSRSAVRRRLADVNVKLRQPGVASALAQQNPELRLQRSITRTGELNPAFGKYGKDHPAWKPNKITPLYKSIRNCAFYKQWREQVFERDNFTCQLCKNRGGNLNADHVIPLCVLMDKLKVKTLDEALLCNELWIVTNGRTLCVKCHRNTNTYSKRVKQYEQIN